MKSIKKVKEEVKEEKIIYETEWTKHIQLSDGSVRIINKSSNKKPSKDFWVRIPQAWWRNDLKELNPTARAILISWKIIGIKYPKPSERFIARELHISRNSVAKYVKELRKTGHI